MAYPETRISMGESLVRTHARTSPFNHVQKEPAVHDPVKNRTQPELIVSAERGETDDRHAVLGGRDRRIHGFVFNAFDIIHSFDA